VPRRSDIKSVLIIGSGPIVIGQACEFDYAGCQALKVLREDGFRTIVVNWRGRSPSRSSCSGRS